MLNERKVENWIIFKILQHGERYQYKSPNLQMKYLLQEWQPHSKRVTTSSIAYKEIQGILVKRVQYKPRVVQHLGESNLPLLSLLVAAVSVAERGRSTNPIRNHSKLML